MSKKKKSGFEIDPNKSYTFKLTRKHEGRYIIPNKTDCWDEDKQETRTIRLTQLSKTPYLDEQPESATDYRGIIQFTEGVLRVSGKEEYKIRYLLAHDGNISKGGDVLPSNKHMRFKYKLIDEVKGFKDKAALRKLKIKMQNELLEASKEDLQDFLLATYGYNPRTGTEEELLEVALSKVDKDVEVVKNNFKSEKVKLKSKIINLFKDKKLRNEKGTVTWTDGGLKVHSFKVSEENKLVDQMIEWIAKESKEAKDFSKKLSTV